MKEVELDFTILELKLKLIKDNIYRLDMVYNNTMFPSYDIDFDIKPSKNNISLKMEIPVGSAYWSDFLLREATKFIKKKLDVRIHNINKT